MFQRDPGWSKPLSLRTYGLQNSAGTLVAMSDGDTVTSKVVEIGERKLVANWITTNWQAPGFKQWCWEIRLLDGYLNLKTGLAKKVTQTLTRSQATVIQNRQLETDLMTTDIWSEQVNVHKWQAQALPHIQEVHITAAGL